MRRHFTQPLYAGVAHGGVGVEAFGDGMTNHRLPFFFQQLDQLLLLRDQGIDLGGFVVEEVGDFLLFNIGRK
jgi:hypothetical protein